MQADHFYWKSFFCLSFCLQNIEYALGQDNSPQSGQHSARIQEELRTLILKRKARNEDVFEWIDVSRLHKMLVKEIWS